MIIELREQAFNNYDFGLLILPFTTLVALLTSFRVNAAFNKWLTAHQQLELLHSNVCDAVARVTTFIQHSTESEELVLRFRRQLVLGCVFVQKHVRGERTFEDEQKSGLISEHEVKRMTKEYTSISCTLRRAPTHG